MPSLSDATSSAIDLRSSSLPLAAISEAASSGWEATQVAASLYAA
jgi:hypothetical protein